MHANKMAGLCILVLAAVLSASYAEGGDDVTLRLKGVPERLAYPLPRGANRVLTAVVKGEAVDSVWLAGSREARARVLLAKVGEGEYQINLADPEVEGLLRTAARTGRFQVFARTRTGKVVASLPVRYTVNEGGSIAYTLEVQEVDGVHGIRLSGRKEQWFQVGRVLSIDMNVKGDVFRCHASAVAGKYRPFPAFKRVPGLDILRLELTPEIREKWRSSYSLDLMFGIHGQKPRTLRLLAAPEFLMYKGKAASFPVVQRRSQDIPGSRGYLKVRIGDVTGGQTFVEIRASGRTLVGQTPLREGDRISFSLGLRTSYTLQLIKMVNFLFGDDYCVFLVTDKILPEVRKIETLLHAVRHARVKFCQGDTRFTPRQMEIHLRKAWQDRSGAVKTHEAFLDLAGEVAKSDGDGGEIRVKLSGDRSEDLAAWLRSRAALLCREPGKKPATPKEK